MSHAKHRRKFRVIVATLLAVLLGQACDDKQPREAADLPAQLKACDSGPSLTEFKAGPGVDRSAPFELSAGPIALSVWGRGRIGARAEVTAADGRVVMSSQVTTLTDRSCISGTVPAGEYVVVVSPPSEGGSDWGADVVIRGSVP